MANMTSEASQISGDYTTVSDLFTRISAIHLIENPILNSILLAALIFLGSFIFAWIAHFILEKIVYRLTKKTKTKVDDLIVEKTKKPFYYIILFYGFRLALYPLTISPLFENILVKIIYSLIIITIFYIISKSLNIIIEEWGKSVCKRTKSNLDDQLLSLFHKIINITIIIIAILVILSQWGIKITPILASLGIAGIALGLALQNTLGNVFGGVQMILDENMDIGDQVKIGSDISGTVDEIGIRSTKIVTFDNELLIVPNGQLANMTIQNISKPAPHVRVVINFGVEYGSDPKRVKKVIEEALDKTKFVLKKPAHDVIFTEMGDFALKFQARFWIESYKTRIEAKVEANNLIYEALKKNNIGIPFPTQTIHLKKED